MVDEQLSPTPLAEPSIDISPEIKDWYVVQVASGCEKKVKHNLEQRLQTLDVARSHRPDFHSSNPNGQSAQRW